MVKFHEASSSNSIFEKRKRKGRQRFSLCIGSPYSFFFVNDRVFRRHASRTERERGEASLFPVNESLGRSAAKIIRGFCPS